MPRLAQGDCKDKIYDGEPAVVDFYYSNIVGRRVLDVGCGTGNLCRALATKGNECYGITISEQEAVQARAKLRQVIVGDLETMEALPFPEQFFDVVIFADVLEHLKNPARTLQLVKPYLKPGARLIASIPNIANFVIRFNLLCGRFEYTREGILDNTHLRFFTLGTAQELITLAGYRVEGIKFTHSNWRFPKLMGMQLVPYEWEIQTRIARWWPGPFATQFVIYATYPDK